MLVNFSNPDVFLHPGEFYFGSQSRHVGTLLGSCVAVTVWYPNGRLGGMSHIVLPQRQRPAGAILDCRYADEAIERFFRELQARQVSPTQCHVKLFGGGNMFAGGRAANNIDVGRRNIEATRDALAFFGFQVMSESVGGAVRRRLSLDLHTGSVWMATPVGQ